MATTRSSPRAAAPVHPRDDEDGAEDVDCSQFGDEHEDDTRWPPAQRGDRVLPRVLLLVRLMTELADRDAALEWVRFAAAGKRHATNPAQLARWNRAYLAFALAHELGALGELDAEVLDPIVLTARNVRAPGAPEYFEAASASLGD